MSRSPAGRDPLASKDIALRNCPGGRFASTHAIGTTNHTATRHRHGTDVGSKVMTPVALTS
ncbi:hypothetical protein [Kribbella yunnanensis]|uniref:hypothetical protein n=1 Tax=Kribbella yunnanensis TaxID=190194 RepID=UPI0031E0B81E